MAEPIKSPRLHKATFARDKFNPGKWNIRVEGPNATKFEGKKVPVTMMDGTEQEETLDAPFWSGTDDKTGKPVCLYHFTPAPKEAEEEATF